MKDERAREARSARRAARAERRAERARGRVRRHASIRGAMSSHRAFMDELQRSGQKLKHVKHPLAAVLLSARASASMASAVQGFFEDLMTRAADELEEAE